MLEKMGYRTGIGLGAEGNKVIMAPIIAATRMGAEGSTCKETGGDMQPDKSPLYKSHQIGRTKELTVTMSGV